MAFEQKDDLYWVIVNDPKLPPEELAKHQKELSAAEAGLYVKVYELLDGQKVVVKKCSDSIYALWDRPVAINEKAQDAYYAIEQDPVFGAWHNNRKGFDKAWEEGWANQSEITLAKEFFKSLNNFEKREHHAYRESRSKTGAPGARRVAECTPSDFGTQWGDQNVSCPHGTL